MKKIEIGGSRLGSGGKMSVEMHGYERSTHDLGYIWRSSMAPGTLVPFMKQVALPGDTFDIDLNASVLTHPTLGPLFGSFKLQLDVFEAPIRLYQATLNQNITAIGTNIQNILLPIMQNNQIPAGVISNGSGINPDNIQCNPSCLLSYLGVRGWGASITTTNFRNLNAVPLLAYWEIYKNFYSNKQETVGTYLQPNTGNTNNITSITVGATTLLPGNTTGSPIPINTSTTITVNYGAGSAPPLNQIILLTTGGGRIPFTQLSAFTGGAAGPSTWVSTNAQNVIAYATGYTVLPTGNPPIVNFFNLSNIDNMKYSILQQVPGAALLLQPTSPAPYGKCLDLNNTVFSQCGLGLKTYQSDLFQNWLNKTTVASITTSTSVSTAGNVFTIDSLILARKVYDLLNRVVMAGNTYQDWINAAYGHEPMSICQSPIYHGGLSKEIVFQEVVSLAQNSSATQPMGTLAGRGTMSKKHKGGKIRIKVQEPGYIIGIVSITPRLDYSQGNDWDTYGLVTMNDFHKPAMDQIGFQDLITEQLAWWDTTSVATGIWTQNSAGKQPAWVNYMTNVNKCYGNFADQNNEMFMTLNRRYQCSPNAPGITDLTTYIDPSHYNYIFAQTTTDAQNFWTQIAIDLTVRRKMSAKVMPNL